MSLERKKNTSTGLYLNKNVSGKDDIDDVPTFKKDEKKLVIGLCEFKLLLPIELKLSISKWTFQYRELFYFKKIFLVRLTNWSLLNNFVVKNYIRLMVTCTSVHKAYQNILLCYSWNF